MNKNEFDKKMKELKEKLNERNITVVAENIDYEQLSCEFYKNNDKKNTISFYNDKMLISVGEGGSLKCSLVDDEEVEFNSDYDRKTFEEVMGIHSDAELNDLDGKLQYSLNNWFNVYCSNEENKCVNEQDPGVIYSLEELLDADYVIKLFEYYENYME